MLANNHTHYLVCPRFSPRLTKSQRSRSWADLEGHGVVISDNGSYQNPEWGYQKGRLSLRKSLIGTALQLTGGDSIGIKGRMPRIIRPINGYVVKLGLR